MLPELKGKGLFVFSDPGGAKPVLALAHNLKAKDKALSQLIISDREYDFFSDFGVSVTPYSKGDEWKQISLFEPDFIFTGTSYTSNIELLFIEQAQYRDIFSYSFIDHYSKFLERFESNGKLIFPSSIAVIDDTALVKAVQSGLPPDKLVVTGNPYHEYISNWRPSVTKEQLFQKYGLDPSKKIILYAPDPLTNVGGKDRYGCDEVMALDTIIECVEQNKRDFHIVVKPHPNQNLQLFEQFTGSSLVTVLTAAHLNTLLFYSNMVISFFSNILIEADLLGVKSCRMLIDFKGDDYLGASVYNNINKAITKNDLINLLNTL